MSADDHQNVLDIKGEDDFAKRVEVASAERAVVVDFWAEWCAPCRVLGPVLERVVESFAGKAVLAKVNVDENQALAAKWQIRGIPAVKIFKGGKVVKDLVGALPESELRRELSEVVPSEADDIAADARRLEEDGEFIEAADRYRRALALRPGHPSATIGLARIAFGNGDYEEARELAEAIDLLAPEREDAEGILAMLGFSEACRDAGGKTAIEERLAREPENLDLVFGLGCCLAAARDHRAALDQFLAVVERDKHYSDDAAKKAMVSVFGMVGQRSELADEYREKLTRLLYS